MILTTRLHVFRRNGEPALARGVAAAQRRSDASGFGGDPCTGGAPLGEGCSISFGIRESERQNRDNRER